VPGLPASAPRATSRVFADGGPNARIVFVGEAPGGDEDIQASHSSAAPASFSPK
jgi:uracil-DNA glycosylase